MAITGGFGVLLDLVTGRPRRWHMRGDGIKRWISNDMPCDAGRVVCGARLFAPVSSTAGLCPEVDAK